MATLQEEIDAAIAVAARLGREFSPYTIEFRGREILAHEIIGGLYASRSSSEKEVIGMTSEDVIKFIPAAMVDTAVSARSYENLPPWSEPNLGLRSEVMAWRRALLASEE